MIQFKALQNTCDETACIQGWRDYAACCNALFKSGLNKARTTEATA